MPVQTLQPAKAMEIKPDLPNAALPSANWADAFEIENCDSTADMKSLAQQVVGTMPRWARALLALRNMLVVPFGLKPDGLKDVKDPSDMVAIFPVLHQNKDSIVLGMDDKHLDFRLLLERSKRDQTHTLRLTTLVTRHNVFGRAYIAVVTPFHKMIVRSTLNDAQ
ncbi:MAG: DUF2867 domain-containing protein [Tateyamaria sp.]|uniref:DUF2867 domain-containing protein n=1 Tax=Tateyamaria sp. TaxID=1929288 RepID=UPI00326EF0C5